MKKRILSIMFAICMALMLVPITANAMQIFEELSVTGEDTLTLQTTDTESQNNGWVEENGQKYYLKDGVKLTDWHYDIPGWEGKWLCFDRYTGALLTGWHDDIPGWEGQWFYFDPDTGVMLTDWHYSLPGKEGKWVCFDRVTGVMRTGWHASIPGWEGQWFYFDENTGVMLTDWHDDIPDYEGQWFCFDRVTGVMRTGWHANIPGWEGQWFYFDENTGVMQTGWHYDLPGKEEQWVYLDPVTGVLQNNISIKPVSSTDSIWSNSTANRDYVVNCDVTIDQRVIVSGNINLFLMDGYTLTVNGGIQVEGSNSLTIYGQAAGTGTLIATGKDFDAGIGGSRDDTVIGGTVTINGGTVTATSMYGAGIGGGYNNQRGGTVTINGGIVTAESTNGGAGIGGGDGGAGGNGGDITITGGSVKATGKGGAGIGGSSHNGSGGNITITGGSVKADSEGGAGIGGGDGLSGGSGGTITITGGTVTANSKGGAGIGGGEGFTEGCGGFGGIITISGGTVTATSDNGVGIGGDAGRRGQGGNEIFQTNNGNAVIITDSIVDKTNQGSWNGVIFEGNVGKVYGTSVTPIENFTIDSDMNLLIPENAVLTINDITAVNNGSVYVDGTVSGLGGDLYYPLTVDGGTADKTYTYNSKSYGKAGGTIALSVASQVGKIITWSSSPNVDVIGNSFTMPNKALTVTAQWVDCPHTGDKETRNAKAATCTEEGYTGDTYCTVCKKEISKGAAINMLSHKLDNIPAKDATVTEIGNKEYWQCKDCKKYFSDEDGNTQIVDIESWKTGDGKIDKFPPEIIEGKGQSITTGEKKELTFRSNAAFNDFIRVELDGKELDEKYYTVKEGSTIVTLKEDFVSTLSAGEHIIGIVSTSGTASTTFTVAESQKPTGNNPNDPTGNNPNTGSVNHVSRTGDSNQMVLWLALLFASGILLSVLGIYGNKKKHNR